MARRRGRAALTAKGRAPAGGAARPEKPRPRLLRSLAPQSRLEVGAFRPSLFLTLNVRQSILERKSKDRRACGVKDGPSPRAEVPTAKRRCLDQPVVLNGDTPSRVRLPVARVGTVNRHRPRFTLPFHSFHVRFCRRLYMRPRANRLTLLYPLSSLLKWGFRGALAPLGARTPSPSRGPGRASPSHDSDHKANVQPNAICVLCPRRPYL